MTKQEILEMIHRAGFDLSNLGAIYNRVGPMAAL